MDGKMKGLNSIKLNNFSGVNNIEVRELSYKDIAIIGMAGSFPQAATIEDLWEKIKNGTACVSGLPEIRRRDVENYLFYKNSGPGDYSYLKGSYLEDIDKFDYQFFKLTPKEAGLMSPMQRLFLQTAWHAIENAGYGGRKLKGTNTGVYIGYIADLEGYKYREMIRDVEDRAFLEMSVPGNLASIISGRLSYILDLKGPSMLIDTACSSSLVALHTACQAIRNGDCDTALVGGVRINLLPVDDGVRIGIESADGITRTFDDKAGGTGLGEGAAVLILKPLIKAEKDNDHIYAVIKGSAVNQDGASMGITAPNSKAQVELLVKAWRDAGINPETISYIEAHGTGTSLGDPIEIEGIKKAFEKYTRKKQFCAISSVKANIGHLYDIAGLVGLVKAVMALQHKQLPPAIHFKKPNKNIDFVDSPVYVCDKLEPWETKGFPRRCGVSSFGFSGTNCHIILEDAPVKAVIPRCEDRELKIFTLSAHSEYSFKKLVNRYKAFLSKKHEISLTDLCYTAGTGRGHYSYRLAVIAKSMDDLRKKLDPFSVDSAAESAFPVCYGFHKTVSSKSELGSPGTITEAETEELNELVKNKVYDYTENSCGSKALLEEIALLYVKGAEVPWEQFYKKVSKKTITLPDYPFDLRRCWVNIPVNANVKNFYYQLAWGEENFNGPFINKKIPSGGILILTCNEEICTQTVDKLRQEKRPVIRIKVGKNFIKHSDSLYELGSSLHDYYRLLEELKDCDISQVLYLSAITRPVSTLKELQESLEQGAVSLFRFIKAYTELWQDKQLEVVLVSDCTYEVTGHEEILRPENAPLYALGKVIENECPSVSCKCLDIDETADTKVIIDFLNLQVGNDILAFRKNKWYKRELQKCRMEHLNDKSIVIRDNGVYIITGGAGGIGSEIARYLASKKKVNLILLNRTKLSDRKDSSFSRRRNLITDLESLGAQVEYISADVSNYEEMRFVLSDLRMRFSGINGIIHCAGSVNPEMLKNKSEAEFVNILSPKVYGTWVINELTKEDNLDFFVLFSSIASFLCLPGQGDYAAANNYLDAVAAFNRKHGRSCFSINWPAWQETGMAAALHKNIDTVFKTISTEKALECFEWVLGKEDKDLIIGELHVESEYIDLLEMAPVSLSAEIRTEIKNRQNRKDQCIKQSGPIGETEVILLGKESTSYTGIEKKIAQICKRILGFEQIDINESFFDLGADSIQLSRMFNLLDHEFPGTLTAAKIFAYPNVKALGEYISGKLADKSPGRSSPNILSGERWELNNNKDIAIIGLALDFPHAITPDAFWKILSSGSDCIRDFPESRKKDIDGYVHFLDQSDGIRYQKAAYLNEIDKFDYNFFKLSPKESGLMDPNQRLFLQTAYAAIEDAGYGGKELIGTKTGIFVGFSKNSNCEYIEMVSNIEPESLQYAIPGNLTSIIPSRISYLLNLKGPSMLIDTACSSSLVAVHQACQSLRNGDCDYAVAGGVKLKLLPVEDNIKIGIESSDYKTRAFDDFSDGTGMGEGVAAVLLKPLSRAIEDRDNIYAVIKGSAVNQDGRSVGITAPNGEAQTEVIISAWKDAGVHPETITFIEAHGTGTKLGDPIEIDGLTEAFRQYTNKRNFCAISSVKTNIGHLLEGAGIAGLLKAVLSLKHKELPPSLHFKTPNRLINFIDSPLYLNQKLTPWESKGIPRRCGVSSFGFSGTNCHVVLEEAPEVPVRQRKTATESCIFTVSAKNKHIIYDLAKKYFDSINGRKNELDINDLCYTVSTGRGHFECRLAFIVKSIDDLLDRLKQVLQTNTAAGQKEKGIYYGEHYVVGEEKQEPEENDILENELTELTERADRILKNMFDGKAIKSTLQELCELYVKGADVNWASFYRGQNRRKISLPAYPFARSRCWLKITGAKGRYMREAADIIHPLLEKCCVKSIYNDIYATEFSLEKHFVLSEHRVQGNFLVPGVSYLEVAKQVSRLYFGEVPVEIKDLSFTLPVMIREGETRTVQTIVQVKKDHLEFIVASQEKYGSGEWIKHAEGKIYKTAGTGKLAYDLNELKKECSKTLMTGIDVNKLARGFINYGPRWHCFHTLYTGEDTALAEFLLPQSFSDDLILYYLHPSLLDLAVSAWALTLDRKYLPFAYKSFKIYGPTPLKFYSYLRKKSKGNTDKEVLLYDIVLIDTDGNVFGEITDFALKRADNLPVQQQNNLYSHIKWVKSEKENRAAGKPHGLTIVFTEQNTFNEEILSILAQESLPVVSVRYGDSYKKHGAAEYIIRNNQEDHEKLIKDLKEHKITQIIHLVTTGDDQVPQDLTELKSCLKSGLYSLFYIIKGITRNNLKNSIDITLVSKYVERITGNEEEIYPHNASMVGLAKAAENEIGNINIKCIDIDQNTGAGAVVEEIYAASKESKIAFRNNARYREEMDLCELGELPDRNVTVRENGLYIITGGTGGIGLEIGRYLAAHNKVIVCFISRSKLPPRDLWDTVLEEDKNKKICRAIKVIREIESAGSTVESYKADISSEEEVKSVIDSINRKYGRINGIVHSAGIAGEGFILDKKEETLSHVISPKIYGTWILERFTRDFDLDFFVLCSSVAALLRYPGQGDYTAANAYMDSFAELQNYQGRRCLAINWTAWKETGMAVDHHMNIDTLFKSISTERALAALGQVIKKEVSRIIIGEINYPIFAAFESFSIRLSSSIEKLKNRFLREQKRSKRRDLPEVRLKGKSSADYNDVEVKVSQIWANVLGLEEIDIYRHFFDLGGDSIMATRLYKEIEREYPHILDITDVFAYSTVSRMSKYIENNLKRKDQNVSEEHDSGIAAEEDQSGFDGIMDVLDRLEKGELSVDEADSTLFSRSK